MARYERLTCLTHHTHNILWLNSRMLPDIESIVSLWHNTEKDRGQSQGHMLVTHGEIGARARHTERVAIWFSLESAPTELLPISHALGLGP